MATRKFKIAFVALLGLVVPLPQGPRSRCRDMSVSLPTEEGPRLAQERVRVSDGTRDTPGRAPNQRHGYSKGVRLWEAASWALRPEPHCSQGLVPLCLHSSSQAPCFAFWHHWLLTARPTGKASRSFIHWGPA